MIYNYDSLSFQILAVSHFFHKKGKFNVKARPYAALSYRVSGRGDFKIGDKHLSVGQGDILFIPADISYEVEYSVSESIVVHLNDCNYCEAEALSVDSSAEIFSLFERLCDLWSRGRSVNGAKSSVYAILEKIGESKNEMISNNAFSRCLDYIDANLSLPSLNVTMVARAGFTSVSSLQRIFLQHFGISPMQYIIKLRMNKALQLLVENRLTVKEISFSCGFSDEKYFSRAFKQRYGYPPSRFMENKYD